MKFNENPNVAVLTTKDIIAKKTPILFVSHDEDDGMWQFMDTGESDFDKVVMVRLKEIVELDGSVNMLSDLPPGWQAWRKDEKSKWVIEKSEEE